MMLKRHMIGEVTLLPYKEMDSQNNYSYQTFERWSKENQKCYCVTIIKMASHTKKKISSFL